MIKEAVNTDNFLEICDKLEELKNVRLTQKALYNYMVQSLYSTSAFTLVSHDKDKMNGCIVLFYAVDQLREPTLCLLFVWIDPHYPKLHNEFIKIACEKGRELKVKKLSVYTDKSEAVIKRRLGKYGFNKKCSVYEKELI